MIRFIIIAILLVIFLIVSIPIQLVMLLIGFVAPDVRDKTSLRIVNWAFGVVIKLSGIKKTVIGYENVPKDEAVLYVMNHRSIFDIILTYTLMPG
ncbi:MAG: 1-acyl-sn-glycerol-3-phosphate acyltransferase, partial [Lachnospiraceae bacterium]|nr:1-acyl-sn-glycerol-3-phosphate acyltransferase [Lachnospiraceae bacterium]